MFKKITKSFNFNGKEIIIETGHIGFRADAAIMVRQGDTVLNVMVTVSDRPTELDYFPLGINYVEKFYAAGVISGSRFIKRERRPSDEGVVKGRQIDRALRPLFPEGFKNEVNVTINVLAYDGVADPVVLAINAASIALMMSSVPFDGPAAGVRVAIDKDGKLMINPNLQEMEDNKLDAAMGVNKNGITMLEVGANQVTEDEMKEAFKMAFDAGQESLKFQEEIRKELGKEKIQFVSKEVSAELVEEVEKKYKAEIVEALFDDENRKQKIKDIENKAIEEMATGEEGAPSKFDILAAIWKISKKITRHAILEEKKRLSARAMDEIRELHIEVGVLPRVHGSALFSRGNTQVLSIVTLGSLRLEQSLEEIDGESTKRYMHHYNGPRYSMGEAGRMEFYPGNREIGHGAMAEKALEPMIPSRDEFPYTVRVVSEILSQNGSSSQAATCGSTLALMDAGVPIKAPVAGIAIGLVTSDEQSKYQLVTDMQDVEDFYGDMDFKVMGTSVGITAIQMDTKQQGVKVEILQEALGWAKKGRMEVLDAMSKVISEPRKELNEFAPKVEVVQINKEKIGELIGPGGKNIKAIMEQVGDKVDIEIEDDGRVIITTVEDELMQKAVNLIKNQMEEPEVGKIYDGVIDKVVEFGAFVNISPQITGLIHVSEMSNDFVKDPNTLVKSGDKVKVKLISMEKGRQSYSMKAALDNGPKS